MGDRVEWTNQDDDYHSVSESSGLGLWESQLIRGLRSHNPETWWKTIPWAGTFTYRDMVFGFEGTLEIPDRALEPAESSSQVSVEIGVVPPPDGVGFDVQLQTDNGTWRTVYEGIGDTQVTFSHLPPGSYAVRSRLRRLDSTKITAATDWAPPEVFMVE